MKSMDVSLRKSIWDYKYRVVEHVFIYICLFVCL